MFTMIGDSLIFLHGRHLPQCTAVVDKYFDGYYTLQFMAAGNLYLRYDNNSSHLYGRWLWPAAPGAKTFFTCEKPSKFWDHRYVAFQGPLVNAWISEGLWPTEPLPAPERQDFDDRFDLMIECVNDPSRLGRLRGINILESILIDLFQQRTQNQQSSEPWLNTVLEAIAKNQGAQLDYDKLARSVGISLSTLRRRFRQQTGMALHSFALEAKMTAARNLLLETQLPIKVIADKLGYKDVYFFSRQFHKLVGLPPGEFRMSIR